MTQRDAERLADGRVALAVALDLDAGALVSAAALSLAGGSVEAGAALAEAVPLFLDVGGDAEDDAAVDDGERLDDAAGGRLLQASASSLGFGVLGE